MKVLMLGWEFPPFISGGLGTACFGLTKAMSQLGNVDVTFVLPRPIRSAFSTHVRLLAPMRCRCRLGGPAPAEAPGDRDRLVPGRHQQRHVPFGCGGRLLRIRQARPASSDGPPATHPRVARFRVVEPGQSTEQSQPRQQTRPAGRQGSAAVLRAARARSTPRHVPRRWTTTGTSCWRSRRRRTSTSSTPTTG